MLKRVVAVLALFTVILGAIFVIPKVSAATTRMYADNKIDVAMQAGKFPVTTALINSYPSAYTTNGTVTNPTLAYDPPHPSTTFATFSFGYTTPRQTYFDVKTFNNSIATPYMVVGIDIKIDYSFTNVAPGIGSAYRISAQVGSMQTEVQSFTTLQRITHGLRTFLNVREPNDGVWNLTDVTNLAIHMEGKNMTATGTGTMNVYDAYVQFPNNRVVVGVRGENMFDVYSYQFKLNYTTTKINYTRYSEGQFLNVAKSEGGSTFPTLKSYYTPSGMVYGSSVMQPPANRGIDDNATLMWVEFRIMSYGVTQLLLTETGMSDSFNRPLTITTKSGWFDNRIRGDITGPGGPGVYDGVVNTYDLGYLGGAFGSPNAIADFTGPAGAPDGIVNTYDLGALGGNFGKSI